MKHKGVSPMALTLKIHPPPGRVERSEGRATHRVLGSPSPARSGPTLPEGG
ncbi:similar to neurogenic locus Notch protein [Rhodopirellula baltica SH 1]|uniref:Similar to neurogenic locus Notch protein n=1 Tax=Rhodopirellula baltica (strain DSM 10527 / NCIMB 13988 / SH1) TaxID=243090 RepID=Q7TU14_RHOBA|nr:similar to neurogenic locus Notch protein [Rhodopirellula baltica SH 1]